MYPKQGDIWQHHLAAIFPCPAIYEVRPWYATKIIGGELVKPMVDCLLCFQDVNYMFWDNGSF